MRLYQNSGNRRVEWWFSYSTIPLDACALHSGPGTVLLHHPSSGNPQPAAFWVQHSTTGKLHSMKHHVNESEVIFMISSTRVCPVTIDLSCAPFSVFTCGYKGQRAHFKNGCLHPQWLNVFSVMKLKHGKQHIYIYFFASHLAWSSPSVAS